MNVTGSCGLAYHFDFPHHHRQSSSYICTKCSDHHLEGAFNAPNFKGRFPFRVQINQVLRSNGLSAEFQTLEIALARN